MNTLYEQLGGEAPLRSIIDRFVDRVFDDTMIGFLFAAADRDRVKAKEFEFAARHLGANISYTGKPIAAAHGKHPILGGHFLRRLQILRDTLAEFSAPDAVVTHWVQHTENLRPAVTQHEGSDCTHGEAQARPEPPRSSVSSSDTHARELPLVGARAKRPHGATPPSNSEDES